MATAKQNGLAGKLLGAGLALSAAFTPAVATAQEVIPASTTTTITMTHEAELAELDRQGRAVSTYAHEHENGVGILLHVGDDLRARADAAAKEHNVTPEHALEVMVARIAHIYGEQFAKLGVEAQLFPTANLDARATILSYHISDIVYEDANGNALLGLRTAEREIPRVVEALQYLKKTAQLETDFSAPGLDGG